MLQQPKQLIMDGYRFQDAMFPPQVSSGVQFPRLGVFKVEAYIDADTEAASALSSQSGGAEGSMDSAAHMQMAARGQQDRYLLTQSGEQYDDAGANFQPWGKWVDYGYPLKAVNGAFSWGDVLYRYRDDPEITLVPTAPIPAFPVVPEVSVPPSVPVQTSCWDQLRN
jgi:hypothetical protein